MSAEDDLKREIADLKERITQLESMLSEALEPLSEVRNVASNYMKVLELYHRYGSISPDILMPEVKDSISTEIIKVLSSGEELNVTQITDRVRTRRGTASRRIVRERLAMLVEKGIVYKLDNKNPLYKLSEDVVRKWAKVLGFIK